MVINSQRLPITTYLGHTDRALSFYQSDSVYFALGKTTKWDGEDSDGFIPPAPDVEANGLEDVACYKKTTQKMLVMPSESGDITYAGQRWKVITPQEAIENRARWVYITTTMYYDEVAVTEYRQIGIYNRLQAKSGVTAQLLRPNQVEDPGLLIALNNRHRVTRQQDTRETYSVIIEF